MRKNLALYSLGTALLFAFTCGANINHAEAASPKKKKPSAIKAAQALVRQISRAQIKLDSQIEKMTEEQYLEFLEKIENEPDSDGDFIPDIAENALGTFICEEDSDEDGALDGDEVYEGTDPTDPSDGGIEDGEPDEDDDEGDFPDDDFPDDDFPPPGEDDNF